MTDLELILQLEAFDENIEVYVENLVNIPVKNYD